jgi:PAS domain S-box-containing protein
VRELTGSFQDITELRHNELTLKRHTKFLESVMGNIPALVSVKNAKADLAYVYLNPAGEKILGLEKGELIGRTDFHLLPRPHAELMRLTDETVFQSEFAVKIDREEMNTKNGHRIFTTQKVPTFDSAGKPEFLITIATDITEEVSTQKKLEAERAKNIQTAKLATLGELSAGIAHEINNPLAIIIGGLTFLPRFASDPEKLKTKIESVTKAAERIAKIVNGLRKFSRSSEKTAKAPVSLAKLVQESVFFVEFKAKRTETEIRVQIPPDAELLCNEIEIEQVLINLLSNGIDAVKNNKERWVSVEAEDLGSEIHLKMRDSGSGIRSDLAEKIFQPFFTTKPTGEGTGLGLSIVKGIVDDHGGTIELNLNDPHTCFELRLPKPTANSELGTVA